MQQDLNPLFLGDFKFNIYERAEQKQFYDAAQKEFGGMEFWENMKQDAINHAPEIVVIKSVIASLMEDEAIKLRFVERLYNAMIYYRYIITQN